jgi:hypothetical protein
LPKRKTITKTQRKAIRTYVKQGYSANKIQKRLQKQNLGMRRKILLAEIRKVKGQKPKADRKKYTPRKYRKYYLYRKRFGLKQIAGYSTVHGKPRRIQVYGDGKQLYRVMLLTSQHPPKQQFLTMDAPTLLSNPWRYLSKGEHWDTRPRIES